MSAVIRMRCTTVLGLILAVGLLGPAGTGAAAELSLRIESKSRTQSATEPGVVEVTYTLVNTSQKVITAWELACVSASHLGSASVSGVGTDGYTQLALPELLGEAQVSPVSALIRPGERVSRVVAFEPDGGEGPFAAKSCGPVLLIFEDATFEGDSRLASARFDARSVHAVESLRAHALLRKSLESGSPLMEALDVVLQSQPQGIGFDKLRTDQRLLQLGARSADATSILEELYATHLAAMAHLPTQWQERVEKEVHE